VLVLFDIDGTLLRSSGVGLGAMREALEELHPGRSFPFEGIPVAGRLDTHIWRDFLALHALEGDEDDHARFRARYADRFARRIGAGGEVRALAGAAELATRLGRTPGVTVGLLTGNYPETGRMKIVAAGIEPDLFRLGAYAGDGPDRRSLTPVAMRRLEEREGRRVAPREVVVIGDTPLDVDCAAVHGCRSLAVATGHHGEADLRDAGADRVAANLADTEALLDWILAR